MFLGFDSFRWFEGVVEDRFDPLELGRVRVRVYGIHTSQKVKSEQEGIPTDELLWMTVATPTTSARTSGIGDAPLGLLEGSEVFGYFKDQMCQVGVVLFSTGGIERKNNPSKGFSDPNGVYPREGYIKQQDVNKLARTSSLSNTEEPVYENNDVGKDNTVNKIQEVNRDVAVKPDDTPVGEYVPNDNPDFSIETMLARDEGIRNRVYWDSEGYPTVGIGHLIIRKKTKDMAEINKILGESVGRTVSGAINESEISSLFKQDLGKVQKDIKINSTTAPVYNKMNKSRQMALENMGFQMGVGGLAKFKNTLKAMNEERWEDAYRGLLDSLWAKQTPGRAQRVAKIILTGNLESYGVMQEKSQARMMAFAAPRESSPEDPFTPTDSRIMFKEPESSYNARYPYNKVYESEAGHVEEFDSTPGSERYRLLQPSGTYTELSANGRRVTKIVGEDFLIVQEGRNVNIKGNLNVVIEGDAQIYNMGNVTQTIDGNVTEFIRGNVKQTIEGEAYAHIKQNAEIIVDKDMSATVKQNLNAVVEQDATIDVTQKVTVNAENADVFVKEDINLKAKNIDAQADNITMHGQDLVKITGGTVQVG